MLNNLLLYIFFQFILIMTKCIKAIRVLIVEKLKKGIGQRETARNLGIPRTTVQNIWKHFVATGIVNDKPNPGRPTRYTERDRRKLCIESRRHPFLLQEKCSAVHLTH